MKKESMFLNIGNVAEQSPAVTKWMPYSKNLRTQLGIMMPKITPSEWKQKAEAADDSLDKTDVSKALDAELYRTEGGLNAPSVKAAEAQIQKMYVTFQRALEATRLVGETPRMSQAEYERLLAWAGTSPSDTPNTDNLPDMAGILKALGQDSICGTWITTRDFGRVDPTLANRMLDTIVRAEGWYDVMNQNYIWFYGTAYLPRLHFEATRNTNFSCDEQGKLQNPLDPWRISEKSAFKLGRQMGGVDLNGAVYLTTGNFRELGEDLSEVMAPVFSLASIDRGAKDALIVVGWGGPADKRRGLQEADMKALVETGVVKYAEKCASKNGKKGYDYYVVSTDLVESKKLLKVGGDQYYAMGQVYMDKMRLIAEYSQKIDQANKMLIPLNQKIEELWQSCYECYQGIPEAEVFVTMPEMDFFELKKCDRKMAELDLESLKALGDPTAETATALRNMERFEIKVESWLQFAPRYAELRMMVKAAYGVLEIFDDRAVVALPSHAQNAAHTELIFSFTEKRLAELSEFIDAYVEEESAADTANYQREQQTGSPHIAAEANDRLGRQIEIVGGGISSRDRRDWERLDEELSVSSY